MSATIRIRYSGNRHVTRLGAPAGEYDPPWFGTNKVGDFLTRLFDDPTGITSGLVHSTRISHHAVLKGRHRFGHLLAARGRGGVIEVIEGHATK
jgi:hypothetical protein